MNVQMHDIKNPSLLRSMGIKALSQELTPVGMAYFMRQFENGEGDYTKERAEILDKLDLEDIKGQIAAHERK